MHRDEILQRAHREYMESRILMAQPVVIIEMLYQVAIRSIKAAMTCLANGDVPARTREVNKAHEAIGELMLALDHNAGASFSHTLAELYSYAQREVFTGHARKSAAAFQNALNVMTILEEGWIGVREQVAGKQEAQEPAYEVEAVAVGGENRPTRLSEYQQAAEYPGSRDWSC